MRSPFRRAAYCWALAGTAATPETRTTASVTVRFIGMTLLLQGEAEDDVAGRKRDVLLAVDGIADRRCLMISARLEVPEIFSALRVEREDVAVADLQLRLINHRQHPTQIRVLSVDTEQKEGVSVDAH